MIRKEPDHHTQVHYVWKSKRAPSAQAFAPFWDALPDKVLVFILFLLVSTLRFRHIPALTVVQTRYFPVPYLVWSAVCEWNSISPHVSNAYKHRGFPATATWSLSYTPEVHLVHIDLLLPKDSSSLWTDVRVEPLPTGFRLMRLARRDSCQRTAFLKVTYFMFITTFAQVFLAQRFNGLHRFEYGHSSSPLQNLRDNDEEQMDHGLAVCPRRRRVLSRSLHFYPRCYRPRSIVPPHHICQRSSSRTEGKCFLQLRRLRFPWSCITYVLITLSEVG